MVKMRRHLWWLVLIMLIATGLSARMLASDILFVDEYWSIRTTGGTFGPLGIPGILERTIMLDPGGMGVLYHWLLGAWEYLIGITPFSVRAFSLLAGMLAIAAIYRLGKDLFSSRIGLYAAAILGLSAFFMDYMHEARAYTLLAFFTIATVYFYVQIMRRNKTHWGWYLGLSLSLAAVIYTHYVALSMGVVLGLVHLLHFQNKRRWWMVVLAMALGGMFFIPWLTITMEVIQWGAEDTGRQSNSMNASLILQNLLYTVSNVNLALLALTAFYSLRDFSRKTAIIWIWILVSIVMVILVNTFIPFMVHLRYLMFVFPAFALMIALGISRMKNLALAVLLVWLGAGIYQSLNSRFIDEQFGQIYRAPAEGFELALDTLNQRAQEGDLALFHIMTPTFEQFNYFPLDYYFVETDRVTVDVRVEQFERINNSFARGDVEYLADVETAFEDVDVIWTGVVPEVEQTQRSGVVEFVLATQYAQCETVFAREDMVMQLWARPAEYPLVTTYGDDVIELYDLGRGYQSEESYHVVLGWWAENTPQGVYSIGLHLFDSAGNLVRQQDFGIPEERPFICTGVSVDISDLPAGDYTLRATVYAWQTGERLPTGDAIDYADLRTITIE